MGGRAPLPYTNEETLRKEIGRHCIVPSALEGAIISLFDENGYEVAK